MRFLKRPKRPDWLKWPHLTDETKIRLWTGIFCLFVGAIFAGMLDECALGNDCYQVYTEDASAPWKIKGLLNAEKKAHWLVYGCDCQLAVIVGANDKIIDQVRKGDGRDLPSAE